MKESAIFRDVVWSVQVLVTVGEDVFKTMVIGLFFADYSLLFQSMFWKMCKNLNPKSVLQCKR